MEKNKEKIKQLIGIDGYVDIVTIINTDKGEFLNDEHYIVYTESEGPIYIVDLKRSFYKKVPKGFPPEQELFNYWSHLEK